MASTAHQTDAEIVEHQDPPQELARKVAALAKLLQDSKHAICWTGAGISSTCRDARPGFDDPSARSGIPTFRGPEGKWTLQAQNKSLAEAFPDFKVVNSLNARPTAAHMALVSLLRAGRLKHVISSNTDGMHRRSGVMAGEITELHGNGQKARCDKCHAYGLVDARVRVAARSHSHETAHKCVRPGCGGTMCDTIINFGEYLYDDVCASAERASNGPTPADVMLVLGSSLRVITCQALEHIRKRRGSLVIVNKQITPYDKQCAVRIFADADSVMADVLRLLNIPLAPWVLHRFVDIDVQLGDAAPATSVAQASSSTASAASAAASATAKSTSAASAAAAVVVSPSSSKAVTTSSSSSAAAASSKSKVVVTIGGVDELGIAYSWIKQAAVGVVDAESGRFKPLASPASCSAAVTSQPLFTPLRIELDRSLLQSVASSESPLASLAFELKTFEHRGETPIVLRFPAQAASTRCHFALQFHADERRWAATAECVAPS